MNNASAKEGARCKKKDECAACHLSVHRLSRSTFLRTRTTALQMNVIFVPCHSNPCSVMSLSHSSGLFYTFYYYFWNDGNSRWQMCNCTVGLCVWGVSSCTVTNLWRGNLLWQKRQPRLLSEESFCGHFCCCTSRDMFLMAAHCGFSSYLVYWGFLLLLILTFDPLNPLIVVSWQGVEFI